MSELQRRLTGLTQAQRRLVELRLGRRLDAGVPGAPTPAPLSHAQRRFWWLHQLDPHGCAWNTYAVVEIEGRLEPRWLEASFAAIARRHAVLRTTYESRGGVPLPVEHDAPMFGWQTADLGSLAPADQAARFEQAVGELVRAPFDLARGPLLRAGLWRFDAGRHRLAIAMHHIVSDRWSMGLLVRELSLHYDALSTGTRVALGDPRWQYADYARAQEATLASPEGEAHVEYWRRTLGGELPPLRLPEERPTGRREPFVGGVVPAVIPAATVERLLALACGHNATLFMVLLAAFVALLRRTSGQGDVVVGVPVSGRRDESTQDLIGCFLDTLPLRCDASGDPTFRALLERVRRACLDAFSHQDLPFERIVERLNPERRGGASPFFRVMFTLNDAHDPLSGYGALQATLERSGLRLRTVELEQAHVPCDLVLHVERHEAGVTARLAYDTSLFEDDAARRALRAFETLVQDAALRPDVPLSRLALLDPAARAARVEAARGPALAVPRGTLEQVFEQVTARAPERVAVVAEGQPDVTYAELNARADAWARALVAQGVRPGDVVALQAQRRAALIAATLGVLKAGAAYLPIDPECPPARRDAMLEAAGARLLLCDHEPAGAPFPALRLDREPPAAAPLPRRRVAPEIDRAAYVCFTSGSTGRPKGVMVTHQGVLRLVFADDRVCLGPDETVLHLATFAYDASTWEIWGALLHGARLALYPERVPGAGGLEHAIAHHGVTTLLLTTSLFHALVDEAPGALRGLKQMLVGGEALSLKHARAARRALPGLRLVNAYGPTEAAVIACLQDVPLDLPETWASVPIGRSISNGSAHALDAQLEPVPVGVAGELCVGGEGLAWGYVGQPALTAAVFVPDPFAGRDGARLYRTGDLVTAAPDGTLEFIGRRDQQVKIRGFRTELGEVESALLLHPDVREAVVLPRVEPGRSPRLVACLVARGVPAPDLQDVRRFLAQTLPEYMLPTALVTLDALPRLDNQKIDRRALGALPLDEQQAGEAEDQACDPPQGEVELALAEIWGALLGVQQVSRSQSFFALGGHSILATQLAARIERRFQVAVPLRALMEQPTIAAMAGHVQARRDDPEARASTLPALVSDPAARHEPFPLTDVQQAYWIGRTTELPLGGVSSHGYQELDVVDLDLARLEDALQRLVERHDMLRAVVDADGRQRVLREVPRLAIPALDLRGLGAAEREAALLARREELSHEVRRSDTWPLLVLRASLVDERRTRLHVSVDALIGDAWSFLILGRELARLYHDPAAELEPLEVTFRDYVTTVETLKRGSRAYAESEAYWRERLKDLPPAPPLGRPGAAVAGVPRFTRRRGRLEREDWARLKARAAEAGVSPTGLLLAAFSEVIAAWSGAARFTLTLTLFNRLPLHPHVARIVGDFTSLTLLCVERRREAFAARAKRLQRQLFEALDHRFFTGVQVLRELRRMEAETSAAALPVVFTSLLAQDMGAGAPLGEPGYGITQTPQVSLDHQAYEVSGELAFNWDAVEELFPDGALDGMFAAYEHVLRRLAAETPAWEQCAGLVADPDAERRAAFNRTEAELPSSTLHALFARQAEARPDQPAVVTPSRRLTYAELAYESRLVATRLRRAGARPGELVAVGMERGWEQVVAALGVLQAGAAYLPLDPGLPEERRALLLEHGRVRRLLTQPPLRGLWPAGLEVIDVRPRAAGAVDEDAAQPLPEVAPSELAYVIYTSGSTGVPKGVMIAHAGACNTILDLNQRFAVGPQDRVLALSSLSFDLSVYDVFGLLAAGGTIVMPAPGEPDPAHWAALAGAHGVTLWNSVPALMELFVDYLEQSRARAPEALRLVWLSGDWVPLSLPPRLRAAWPQARLVSLGGATEASIWSIAHEIDAPDPSWRSVPYGRPLRNQRIHVLGPLLEPCPAGVAGELFIAGAGLAEGYWGDPEKTRAAFIVHPDSGERLYRTGDLGRHLADMSVELLGRVDFQVKVRGHRIELGEIEAALLRHPEVRAAVVAASGADASRRRLVAYVVPETPPGPDAAALRAFLRRSLPAALVPSACVTLARLPLTANGKVDRAALPEPPPPAPAAAAEGAATPALVERVAGRVAEVLGLGAVDAQANLLELGVNSVELVRIVNALEGEYGLRLRLEDIYVNPTVAGLAGGLEQRRALPAGAERMARALERLRRLSPEERQALLSSEEVRA